jgi:hypothetical protein
MFEVGTQIFCARAGDYVFGPRDVPHRCANLTTAVGRALIIIVPLALTDSGKNQLDWAEDTPPRLALSEKYAARFVPDPSTAK